LLATGLALVILALMFKLSAVPFHMWTPDVYEGSPTPTTTIMAALPKLAAFVLLVRLLNGPLSGLTDLWQPALSILAILSMLVGAMIAIIQTNLKRLLAWSTIANVGFILTGVVAANVNGHAGILFYLATYGMTQIGLFAVAQELELRQITTVPQLTGFAARNPRVAATLLVLLFSLAGVPPLVGFFAKIGVFGAAVSAGFGPLVVVGVAASVVAAFYSLWLIKLMYFDPAPASGDNETTWTHPLA
jgi:NADH-quinone oxidoreductase subunit N